jgi:hypothetical protein
MGLFLGLDYTGPSFFSSLPFIQENPNLFPSMQLNLSKGDWLEHEV